MGGIYIVLFSFVFILALSVYFSYTLMPFLMEVNISQWKKVLQQMVMWVCKTNNSWKTWGMSSFDLLVATTIFINIQIPFLEELVMNQRLHFSQSSTLWYFKLMFLYLFSSRGRLQRKQDTSTVVQATSSHTLRMLANANVCIWLLHIMPIFLVWIWSRLCRYVISD